METNSAQRLAPELATKFVSLDRVEFDSVINMYFDSNCTQTSRLIEVQGVSRIKKLAALEASVAADSHIVGVPVYDPSTETIKFAYERAFHLPTIPTFIPLAVYFNEQIEKVKVKSTWDSQLSFNAAFDEQGDQKLYVTKVGPTMRRNTSWFEDTLPFALIRPFISVFVILFSDFYSVTSRHHIAEEGLLGSSFAIFTEMVGKGGSIDTELKVGALRDEIGDALWWPIRLVTTIFRMGFNSVKSIILFIHNTMVLDDTNPFSQLFAPFIRIFNILYLNIRHVFDALYSTADEKAKARGIPTDRYYALGEGTVQGAKEWFSAKIDGETRSGSPTTIAPEPHHNSQTDGAPSYASAVKE